MSPGHSRKAKLNFEQSMKRLEEIVGRLEGEPVPLEDSIKLFTEGKELAKACQLELQRVENQVRRLLEDDEGNLTEAPLDSTDSADEKHDESNATTQPDSGGADIPF